MLAEDEQSELDFHGIKVEKDNPEELFELLSTLGKGTFGTVYKARNTQTDAIVAIKMILLAGNDDEVENFLREVKILHDCDHENIVKYYGAYRSLNALWIAMEYCEGGSADQIYKMVKRPLCEALIAYVMREAIKGLTYFHSLHKIHRDIKGGNILLTASGHVKLADFGVSTELMHTLSRRNSFIGTLYWMAPEAIQEKEYDERADIWSMGITLIELAEGSPPNQGAMGQVLLKIPRDPPPTLRQKDMWSPMMHKFLSRLLVKEPTMRPTAAQVLDDPFLSPERLGTADQLAVVIGEVLKKAEGMTVAQRLGDESTGSSATFVENPSDDDAVVDRRGPEPAFRGGPSPGVAAAVSNSLSVPSFFSDGTLADISLLSTADITLDELYPSAGFLSPMRGGCFGGPQSPSSLPSPSVILSDMSPEELERLRVEPPVEGDLLHVTRSLMAMLHHNKHIIEHRGISAEELVASSGKVKLYGTVLKTVLGV